MKKVIIIYFSGTGNTYFACRVLSTMLAEAGCSARMKSIEEIPDGDHSFLSDADVAVFAYPIYGSDMPANMMRFMRNLPERKKPLMAAVMCTQAIFSGDGDTFMGEYLNRKGYRVFRTLQVNICSNLAIPVFNQILKPLFGKELNRKKRRASLKIRKFAEGISKGTAGITKMDPLFIAGGIAQRAMFRISKPESYFKLEVDDTTCTRCALCIKNCPESNIQMSEGRVLINDKCIFCMRCFNICPSYSINLGQATKDSKTYRRFLSEKSILK